MKYKIRSVFHLAFIFFQIYEAGFHVEFAVVRYIHKYIKEIWH